MEINYIKAAKSEYAKSKKTIDNTKTYEPVTNPYLMHGEEVPDVNAINNTVKDIFFDIKLLNTCYSKTALDIKQLMEEVKSNFDNAKAKLNKEKERQQDINMLCNKFTEFDTAIPLTPNDFSGNFDSEGNIFFMETVNLQSSGIDVVSISGNGYEGNKYVYDKNIKKFQSAVIDTSDRKFINDSSNITMYEYSRITADVSEKDGFPEMNFDSLPAICSIVLYSNNPFNTLKITSDNNDLKVLSVETSEDGAIFKQVNNKTFDVKISEKKYNDKGYIPDSGIICFPKTKYVKLVLQSVEYTTETIAFYKTTIEN